MSRLLPGRVDPGLRYRVEQFDDALAETLGKKGGALVPAHALLRLPDDVQRLLRRSSTRRAGDIEPPMRKDT